MCMLCLFILLIPWEGRWQSVSCSLDTYAAAITLLNVQCARNVKFSTQTKHTLFVHWRIFCSFFCILTPMQQVQKGHQASLWKAEPDLTAALTAAISSTPRSDTEPCAACLPGFDGNEILTWVPAMESLLQFGFASLAWGSLLASLPCKLSKYQPRLQWYTSYILCSCTWTWGR